MEIAELKNKTEKELREMMAEYRKKLMTYRFDKAVGKLKKVHEMKAAQRDIARIATLLNAKKQA
ncbi:MAG TPA: 50S ribosomal protein L29 [Candidatus Pacearchaeota archaeon]|nr:50S ribosomal protein L29 [Candidatus Pacearchaeota archaeon]